MIGSSRALLIPIMILLLSLAACGPPPQPPIEPLKEQIAVLQRQLLELQKIQLDTRKKMDELAESQAAVNDTLANKIKMLDKSVEDDRKALADHKAAAMIESAPAPAKPAPAKKSSKKPVKKKKPAVQSPQ